MCGIAGICGFRSGWESDIRRMNDRMRHRGPDASGVWADEEGEVVLGHQRLSIVDLTPSGSQPMVSHSGRYVMAFNGEIYNYRELKKQLLEEEKVERFRGTSDTEVLLEAMECYGVKEAIGRCKGMFAIALYDREERTLHLIRDRIGEKPLYYGLVGNRFVFASEIGSISALDGFDNGINREVLDIYFVHGYIPAPYSIYQGIRKLEPGRILTIRAPWKDASTEEYWSLKETARRGQENPFQGSRQEASEELERLLSASIRDQMVADVPVGAFLSAGIDSATVVALMQSQSSRKVRSFTIGMEEAGYNEAEAAEEIAKHLGTEHTQLYITERDAKEVIPKLPYMFGEPFADSSQIPTYLVSRMTREHVTVSLSGDGGDELFCGYTSYPSVNRIWGKIGHVPYALRRAAGAMVLHSPLAKKDVLRIKGKLLGAKDPADVYRLSYETDPLTARIVRRPGGLPYQYTQLEPGFLKETCHTVMLMDMLMYHPDDILVKVDRTAMAVSLETRVPMLDRDVVEFAWSLPVEYERQGETGKLILRDVLYRHVPKELMDRPKKGFSIPIEKWLREPGLREWAESLLNQRTLEEQGLLNPDVVGRIWDDFINKGIWRIQIWFLLMFQAWMAERAVCVK